MDLDSLASAGEARPYTEAAGQTMGEPFERRPGESAIALPEHFDAGLHFIGRIRTPWTAREDCPKNGRQTDAVCTLALDPLYAPGLRNVAGASHLIVLYWMDRAPRDLVIQQPRHADGPRGTFSLRSPVRPNPIALAVVELLAIDGAEVQVRGLDCLDGTPLLDIKPYYASTDCRPEATVSGWRRETRSEGSLRRHSGAAQRNPGSRAADAARKGTRCGYGSPVLACGEPRDDVRVENDHPAFASGGLIRYQPT